MTEQPFKPGDVVRFKSGTWPMTVVSHGIRIAGGEETVELVWHTYSGELAIGEVPPATLEIVPGYSDPAGGGS